MFIRPQVHPFHIRQAEHAQRGRLGIHPGAPFRKRRVLSGATLEVNIQCAADSTSLAAGCYAVELACVVVGVSVI